MGRWGSSRVKDNYQHGCQHLALHFYFIFLLRSLWDPACQTNYDQKPTDPPPSPSPKHINAADRDNFQATGLQTTTSTVSSNCCVGINTQCN